MKFAVVLLFATQLLSAFEVYEPTRASTAAYCAKVGATLFSMLLVGMGYTSLADQKDASSSGQLYLGSILVLGTIGGFVDAWVSLPCHIDLGARPLETWLSYNKVGGVLNTISLLLAAFASQVVDASEAVGLVKAALLPLSVPVAIYFGAFALYLYRLRYPVSIGIQTELLRESV